MATERMEVQRPIACTPRRQSEARSRCSIPPREAGDDCMD
jgi:hypothetical protein